MKYFSSFLKIDNSSSIYVNNNTFLNFQHFNLILDRSFEKSEYSGNKFINCSIYNSILTINGSAAIVKDNLIENSISQYGLNFIGIIRKSRTQFFENTIKNSTFFDAAMRVNFFHQQINIKKNIFIENKCPQTLKIYGIEKFQIENNLFNNPNAHK